MAHKDQKKNMPVTKEDTSKMFGSGLSFASREAYKLLRTNILFALPDINEERAHIIGVTSSLRGEGKSTSAINLAATLAEMNKKVLLLEADLRLPSIKQKINVQPRPGVTNALAEKKAPFIQAYPISELNGVPVYIDVLVAGDIPPNPSELLSSTRMRQLLDWLSVRYDYIIMDLPPITAVTDALIATKLVDGMILVVRNEHADRNSLSEAIRQIHFVEGNLLGFVFTCANSSGAGYGKKYGKYGKYYKYQSHYGEGR